MARVPGVDWVTSRISEAVAGITPASIGAAAASHAARHAAGGADPVTPESIDAPDNAQVSGSYYALSGASTPFGPGEAESIGTAVNKVSSSLGIINLQISTKADKFGPTYTGHVNDLRQPGAYRISGSSMTAANGYPWTPESTGYVIVHGYSTAYLTQEIVSETGTVWRRNSVAGSSTAWRDWVPVAVDTGWRSVPLENGWTGNLYLRWVNGYATYTVTGLNGSAATSSNLVTNVGSTAFYSGAGRPAYGFGAVSSPASAPSGSSIGSIAMNGGTTNSILRASGPSSAWVNGSASVTFIPMSTVLPANLPGTPA